MVDFYHLFKLGAAAGTILKTSKGAYNAGLIFKTIWKPMATMGAMGLADAAMEEGVSKATKYIIENQDAVIEALKEIEETK